MAETADQYKSRLASYIRDRDPIAMQREAPHTLARLIEGAPVEMLNRRPAPGKWSVRAILAHLAEDGVMVAPIGESRQDQKLYRVTRQRGHLQAEELCGVRFVPLVPGLPREDGGREGLSRPGKRD